jgi:hypothetical protein
MAGVEDGDFDPQTSGSQRASGLSGLFQGMLQPKPVVPDLAASKMHGIDT